MTRNFLKPNSNFKTKDNNNVDLPKSWVRKWLKSKTSMKKNLSLKEQVEHRRKQLAKINNKLKIAYEQNNDIQ